MQSSIAPPVTAYIGIGSNLDTPRRQVEKAVLELAQIADTCVQRQSSLYATPPMGPADQPDYVNAVVAVATQLEPYALLDELQALEGSHGRIRERHWGPRTLDLDLLLYGTLQLHDARLTLPHPGLAERAFVVVPLFEIAADLVIPGVGPLQLLRQRFSASSIQRL